MQTADGPDPAHMRQDHVGTDRAVLWIEEETCSDAELQHTSEVAGVIAIDHGLALDSEVSVELLALLECFELSMQRSAVRYHWNDISCEHRRPYLCVRDC